MKFKFGVTNRLIKKLCLIQYIFRKNNVPDDVFWYILKPLFKTNKNNIYIWNGKKFESVFVYDYDFKIIARHIYSGTNDKLINTISEYNNKNFDCQKFFDAYIISNVMYFMVYSGKHDNLVLYNVFRISGKNICAYTFYNKYDDTNINNIDNDDIQNMINRNALDVYTYYRGVKNNKLKKLGIKGYHIDLLKKMW